MMNYHEKSTIFFKVMYMLNIILSNMKIEFNFGKDKLESFNSNNNI